MLREANEAVARIMQIARNLDGVISGEHGIGLTKYEYLTQEELAPFQEYKQRIDPKGRFNAGKLMPGADLRHAWTPSFHLLGHESLIMPRSEIGSISNAIKDRKSVESGMRVSVHVDRGCTCLIKKKT